MKPYFEEDGITLYCAEALAVLQEMPPGSVQCVVTSPPYWGLRDYGTASWEGGDAGCDHKQWRNGSGRADGIVDDRAQRNRDGVGSMGGDCRKCGARRIDEQLGLEATPEDYTVRMVGIFREVRRVLRADGTLWLNLGDSYAGGGGFSADAPSSESSKSGKYGNLGALKAGGIKAQGVLKPKDLVGIPWRVAFALQADGWYLRSDIIWHKPNPMPESVTDRPTKSHEYLFLLSKSERYHYDAEAIQEKASADTHARYSRGRSDNHKWADGGPGVQTIATNKPGSRFAPGVNPKCAEPRSGIKQNTSFSAAVKDVLEYRNKRSVWTIPTEAYPEAHFATFPRDLVKPCILAGCASGGVVLDPFAGSGTTLQVARELGCKAIGIELKPEYCELIAKRLRQGVLALSEAVL